MKIVYHIPTEQYGFIEIEREITLSKDDIPNLGYEDVKAFIEVKQPQDSEIVSGVGLDATEWRLAFHAYRETHQPMTSELYERMNPFQQYAIQQEKKYYKSKQPKEIRE